MYEMQNEFDIVYHCLFEQSGTFKNEFKKLGFKSFDYDIKNDFGETDFVLDLFSEINACISGFSSIFDNFKCGDYVLCFFPCERFDCQFSLNISGRSPQELKLSPLNRVRSCLNHFRDVSFYFETLLNLCSICFERGFKLIIENPATKPHFLLSYFCFRPSFIDFDRRLNGDYFKKPTAFWFINCQPHDNFLFECLDYVPSSTVLEHSKVERSLISPIYASRFIRRFIL